jgi:hypothetical protein
VHVYLKSSEVSVSVTRDNVRITLSLASLTRMSGASLLEHSVPGDVSLIRYNGHMKDL